MDWTAARARYGGFRANLIDVTAITRAAALCTTDVFDAAHLSPHMRELCTPTARVLFEMLSGCGLESVLAEGVKYLSDGDTPEFTT